MDTPDLLARIPYFRVLSTPQRVVLAGRLRSVAFAPRERIFEEGAPCTGLWIVAEGRIKIFRVSPQGREQVLHVEGPGATLGEVPLFDRAGYVASATAQTTARLLWLPMPGADAIPRSPSPSSASWPGACGRSRAWPAI